MTADRLLVLGWHNVCGTFCFPSRPGWGRRGLRQQLEVLRTVGNVVPLEPALRRLAEGGRLPPRAVALTFDDGYADNLTVAAGLLRRLRLPATFFLVPDLLAGATQAWWEVVSWAITTGGATELRWSGERHELLGPRDRRRVVDTVSASLKRLDHGARAAAVEEIVDRTAPAGPWPGRELFLDWAGARSLVQQGFAIGSHTCRHDILSREGGRRQEDDLRESRTRLERELEVPVRVLAYPNGRREDYDERTVAAAAAAGYSHALTTVDGFATTASRPFEVPRSVVYPERSVLDLALCLRDAVRAGAGEG
jgi:peptidoglycan/xylan/chitin deacetylase (PgdA/CDA1 family)